MPPRYFDPDNEGPNSNDDDDFFDDEDDEELEETSYDGWMDSRDQHEDEDELWVQRQRAAQALYASYKELARFELPSIINAFYSACVQRALRSNPAGSLDETIIDDTLEQLSEFMDDERFKHMPFRTKDAYNTFYDALEMFCDAKPEDLEKHRELLYSFIGLASCCERNAIEVGYAKGRDFCRTDKTNLKADILQDKRQYGANPFTIIGEQTLAICYECPHRYRELIDPDEEDVV